MHLVCYIPTALVHVLFWPYHPYLLLQFFILVTCLNVCHGITVNLEIFIVKLERSRAHTPRARAFVA